MKGWCFVLSQTKYNLYVTESTENPTFSELRNQLCGSENSNMTKIADALDAKADNSNSVSGVLLASAWAGVDSPFIQELEVEGLGATQNGTISVSHDATIVQRDAARNALLSIVGQDEGVLTISADGEMPEVDIPVVVILLG